MSALELRTDGVLLVDKPEGPTSHDIVEAVGRALGGVRCGHAGTLDPFASGLLVLGAGKATRLLRFLSGAEKTYEGAIRLGVATDTDDRTGRPLHEPRSPDFDDEALAAAVASQTGQFDQRPPGFSARKQGGVPSYRLARRGQDVPRPATPVRVAWTECHRAEPGLLRIRLTVSAGTYIRAIARDLGEVLGCGAHLESLRRTASGSFRIEDVVSLPADWAVRPPRPRRGARRGDPSSEDAARMAPPASFPGAGVADPGAAPPRALEASGVTPETLRQALGESLLPLRDIPLGLPSIRLSEEETRRVRTGAPLTREDAPAGPGYLRLLGLSGDLVAVAEIVSAGPVAGLLKPRIVL